MPRKPTFRIEVENKLRDRAIKAEEELAKALALLEQAECPNSTSVFGGAAVCVMGRMTKTHHDYFDTPHETDVGPCEWCADRKQLLGERG